MHTDTVTGTEINSVLCHLFKNQPHSIDIEKQNETKQNVNKQNLSDQLGLHAEKI